MAIDIKGIAGNTLTPRQVGSQPSSARREGATARPPGGETVSLTQTAVSLENMERLMAQIPIVDAHRVESIRESLSKGSYQVNPERTAEKFIRFELMLNRTVVAHAHN
ncbi:MAG: flagellar biosynthesis anti-sigma factor FlgM [Gammaproteobacteria bacterium]|nr:flagellar biosynthesis anti-sigma factor FlgM [Gammaproteobacteria bacterium]